MYKVYWKYENELHYRASKEFEDIQLARKFALKQDCHPLSTDVHIKEFKEVNGKIESRILHLE